VRPQLRPPGIWGYRYCHTPYPGVSESGSNRSIIKGGARYVVKHKDGRRNRYQIQAHLPLPEPASRERTIGELLALLAGIGEEATA
jgi:hypothetical protein